MTQHPRTRSREYVRKLPHLTQEQIIAASRKQAIREADPSYAGHEAGMHPEHQPYLTDDEFDLEEGDEYYQTRLPTSARRYQVSPEQVYTSGNTRYHVRYVDVPKRKSRLAQLPSPERGVETGEIERVPKAKRHIHPLLYLGVGMLAMAALFLLLSSLGTWIQTTKDDLQYGRPRTFNIDAVVGHNDSAGNPTHFIAINLNRHVEVIEQPGGDASKMKVYQITTLFGDGEDLTPVTTQQDTYFSAYMFVCFSLFLILATLTFQLYCITNPLVATITIIPTSQEITLSGTMQLGRVLPPLTISQSQTTRATGHGHQDARAATGSVTFYNGLFTQQFIASGTVYTGQDGVAIVTKEDAAIPPGSPNTGYGTATVTAQAVTAGTSGNIPAGAINITINNGLLVRNNPFSNGQDERTYTTVTQHDIHSVSTVLKTTIAQSITGALQGQLQPNEQLRLLPCNPTVTSDHQPGEEATIVKVTVSQICSAIAFNSQELAIKATRYLATQAQQKVGAGYSLFGTPQVSVTQATVNSTTHHLVFLSFTTTGTWIYGISPIAQQQIKHLLAGKNTQEAEQLLTALPGVESVSIHFSGFGDETRIPKTAGYIHISLIVV